MKMTKQLEYMPKCDRRLGVVSWFEETTTPLVKFSRMTSLWDIDGQRGREYG